MMLTVDDFGFAEPANRLVERAIEAGFPDLVSTMVNLPSSPSALAYLGEYRHRHPRNDTRLTFGLHLNLTEGAPVSLPETVPSLVDDYGAFLGWVGLIRRSLLGQLSAEEVARETEAQLGRLQTSGARYVFFNSHHHVHLWPSIARAVAPVVKHHGIRLTRQPRQLWWPAFGQHYGSKGLLIGTISQLHWYYQDRLSDQFVDFDWVDPSDAARAAALRSVPADAELSCHPHLYTQPSDPQGTPNPTSSLKWLMEHRPGRAGRVTAY